MHNLEFLHTRVRPHCLIRSTITNVVTLHELDWSVLGASSSWPPICDVTLVKDIMLFSPRQFWNFETNIILVDLKLAWIKPEHKESWLQSIRYLILYPTCAGVESTFLVQFFSQSLANRMGGTFRNVLPRRYSYGSRGRCRSEVIDWDN